MEDYEKFASLNEEKYRSYYVPFNVNDKEKYKYGIVNRNSSSCFISLNGKWNIKEYENPSLVNINDDFNATIDVPSCVQLKGYDYNQYVNVNYPIPVNPPYVPRDKNKTWLYRKELDVNFKKNKKYYIVFEGVDSFFYLYVNRKLVGYSSISHAMHEFDITNYLDINGKNEISVVVIKWSVNTYLEDQDKLRFSGIFRDVYLLERPIKHIQDYKIETCYENNTGYLNFINESNVNIELVFNGKHHIVEKHKNITISMENVEIWSSENPNLYKLVLLSNGEKIIEYIGFRNIKIEGNKFYFNNELYKIKGVNRHDFSNINGATVSLKEMYLDILAIKEMNCNSIRTSHYPNAPEFYALCNKMGILVLAEADLEAHGFATKEGGYSVDLWSDYAEHGIFEEGIYMRHVSLVEMLKNNTCIYMWSLGNEASFGKDFVKGAKYIRNRDNRPVHYEGLQNAKKKYYYSKLVDVVSMMYPSIDTIKEKVLNNPKETRPFIMCEYSHAMGNSNGDLKEYWDLINANDNIIGAYVWEFKDHGLLINHKYYYGGDFNEPDHDGNFCIDGLLNPDRTFKSNAYEVKAIYGNNYDESIKDIAIPKINNSNSKVEIEVNKDNGCLDKIIVNNRNILLQPTKLNVLRYIDNELHEQWIYNGSYRLNSLQTNNTYSYENGIHKNIGFVGAIGREPILSYEINYQVVESKLIIDFKYNIYKYVTNLPRIGIEFVFDKQFDKFKYIGFGPFESYIDKHLASTYGMYESNAKANYFNYVRPQESGSHYHTNYVMINDLLEITSKNPYSFSINPYTTNELINCKHDFELPHDEKVVLNLDISHRGIGTHSCGPVLNPKYEVPKEGHNIFEINFK